MTLTAGGPHDGRPGTLVKSMAKNRLFWMLQAAGWTLVGLLSLYPLLQIFEPLAIAVIMMLRVGSGILCSTGLRHLYRRLRWQEWRWWRLMAGVFIFCIAVGTLDSVLTHSLAGVALAGLSLGSDQPPQVHSFVLLMGVLLRSAIYVIWSLLYFGIKLWMETAEVKLRAAETEATARTSELRQLRAQVNPHFLFNALNSILAEKDDAAAVERITQELAEYLRFSLRPAGDYQALGDELDALEHYLRVEKARFEEKLIYTIMAEPGARGTRVPVATVLPLLENAMKYGRHTSPVPLYIRITAVLDTALSVLRLTVANTGRWLEFDPARSHGIGLSNLRRRLELLFDGDAKLSHTVEDGWVRVEVVLPTAPAGKRHEAAFGEAVTS